MRLFLILFLVIFFSVILSSAVDAQSAKTGSIKIVQNDGNTIKFMVYDVVVYGMKGGKVYFGFWVSQNGEWLEDSWVPISPQNVTYDPSYWNGEAFWFTYTKDNLKKWGGNITGDFTGSFFVMNSATQATLGRTDIQFALKNAANQQNAYQNDESYRNNSNRTTTTVYQTTTTVQNTVSNRIEKTWNECFSEAESRLVTHSLDTNFFHDPQLAGEWKGVEPNYNTYGLDFRYIRLNPDATGYLEFVPTQLSTKKTFILQEDKGLYLNFKWAVSVDWDGSQPVTLIKLLFDDGTYLWFYYAKFSEGALSIYQFNDASGKAEGPQINLYDASEFDREWNSGMGTKLGQAMWDYYQKKKRINEQRILDLMSENFIFQNTLNSFSRW
jgi:hypothetical protein